MHNLKMVDVKSYDDFANIVETNMEELSTKRKEIAELKAKKAKEDRENGFDNITQTGRFKRSRH